MSGHSKWSQIKRQKGVADAKRGAIFTKLGREIAVAARAGGPDPNMNFRLRLAIQHAKENNMPQDNIDRAVKRGAGQGEGAALEEIVYEGYAQGGTALLIEALTDNRNRTVSEVRNVLTRGGGSLGTSGSVAWIFESKGVLVVTPRGKDPDDIALAAIDGGAEDVSVEGDSLEIVTAPSDLEKVKDALEQQGLAVESAEIVMQPKNSVYLGEKEAIQALRLVERLEELDDVQRVSINADFDAEVLEKMNA